MTRISQTQISMTLLNAISENKSRVTEYAQQASTGIKVEHPGDSPWAGSIDLSQQNVRKIKGNLERVSQVRQGLNYQEDVLRETTDAMIRAKELASQAANATFDTATRAGMAQEVFALRDHLVGLANSQYQGSYVYGGTDGNDPPYDPAIYTAPATGPAATRYVYDSEDGSQTSRSVAITDDISVTISQPGDAIFGNAIGAMERLGRALAGYQTLPASGAPNGTGVAYTLPDQRAQQTADIQASITLIDSARTVDLATAQATLAGRQKRIDSAESALKFSETNSEEFVTKQQGVDLSEAASNLAQAQTALEASYTVTSKILNLSILDYI